MISDKMLRTYYMSPLAEYKLHLGDSVETEIEFYRIFLRQTDYVAAKMAEASYLGVALTEDYTTVIAARQEAREAIEALQGGVSEI